MQKARTAFLINLFIEAKGSSNSGTFSVVALPALVVLVVDGNNSVVLLIITLMRKSDFDNKSKTCYSKSNALSMHDYFL